MPNPKAVLCLDIDGTLINAQEKVHLADIQRIKTFPDDLQLVLTTGRILHSAKGVLRQNGLYRNSTLPLPGVFLNGGAAYLPDEKLCIQHSFQEDTLRNIIELARAFPTTAFTFFGLDAVYLMNATEFGVHIARLHHLEAQEAGAKDIPPIIIKVMVLERDSSALNEISREARNLTAEMAYSLPYAYEINPPGITKAKTLSTLLHAMRLDDLPIHVVGDGENDLPLFKIAQSSFAPDTAHPKVLDLVDFVISRAPNGLLAPILENIQNK